MPIQPSAPARDTQINKQECKCIWLDQIPMKAARMSGDARRELISAIALVASEIICSGLFEIDSFGVAGGELAWVSRADAIHFKFYDDCFDSDGDFHPPHGSGTSKIRQRRSRRIELAFSQTLEIVLNQKLKQIIINEMDHPSGAIRPFEIEALRAMEGEEFDCLDIDGDFHPLHGIGISDVRRIEHLKHSERWSGGRLNVSLLSGGRIVRGVVSDLPSANLTS